MNGAEHYRKAEFLAVRAEELLSQSGSPEWVGDFVAVAHLHLRLAEVAAERGGSTGWRQIATGT